MFTIVTRLLFTIINRLKFTFVTDILIMIDFASIYNSSENPVITYRYNTYSVVESYFKKLVKDVKFSNSSLEVLGTSVLGKSIYGFKTGSTGPKILMWSQMHGNESTMTRSLFLWLEQLREAQLLKNIQLYIIPVLNPDGNDSWIRNNANNIDLNRDARDLSQPESQILKKVIDDYQPDVAFNLHDQRTIYGNDIGTKAMQLSFLAPAGDMERSITKARLKSMQVINHIVSNCSKMSYSGIGRYDDAFNPNCVGDSLVSKDIPVILFEAGHANDDYNRNTTTVIMAHALNDAVQFVSNTVEADHPDLIVKEYEQIPNIASSYCDIYLKNVPSQKHRVDIAIMYKELIQDDTLYYVPHITSVNDKTIKNGHRVVDLIQYQLEDLDFEITIDQKIVSPLLDINSFC